MCGDVIRVKSEAEQRVSRKTPRLRYYITPSSEGGRFREGRGEQLIKGKKKKLGTRTQNLKIDDALAPIKKRAAARVSAWAKLRENT